MGKKTKACEMKVSIYVHVYNATLEILERKKINKIERPIYQVQKKLLPHNFHTFTL